MAVPVAVDPTVIVGGVGGKAGIGCWGEIVVADGRSPQVIPARVSEGDLEEFPEDGGLKGGREGDRPDDPLALALALALARVLALARDAPAAEVLGTVAPVVSVVAG